MDDFKYMFRNPVWLGCFIFFVLMLMPFPEAWSRNKEKGEYPTDPYILATTYNWELDGISCDDDCSNSAILNELKSEYLGHVAACPLDWVGHVNTTVITLWDDTKWWCLDTMAEEYQEWFWHARTNQWVRVVDFSYRQVSQFPYNQWLIDGYTLQWRPVSEFFNMFETE